MQNVVWSNWCMPRRLVIPTRCIEYTAIDFILHSGNISLFVFRSDLWPLESFNMYCENGILQSHHWTQDQCQDLCQQRPGCVGISYSPMKKSCYVCNDDILFPTAGDLNGYGFYRNPGIMGNHNFGLGSFFTHFCLLWPYWFF